MSFLFLSTKSFKAGDIIIQEGDESDVAYILQEGEVEVYTMRGAEKMVVAKLGAGQMFGEYGLLDRKPRSASVRALSNCLVKVMQIDPDEDL